ncbi:M15 family metallopeptidase [Nakamurella sp.]|uniref:M15 family metallopeptidase n=1 Tax=Nakamurella sp. TaxID=1869182 RepID=UPI003B3A15B3
MIRTVRRIQLIAPASVALLIGVAAAVTVAAVADPPTTRARPGAFSCVPVPGSTSGALDAAQERNAKIIISVALGRGLGPTGAAIGVSVALAESTLFNYANDGTSTLVGSAEGRQLNDAERAVARKSLAFPHDRVGNNLDSIGLFQQRPMTGWGTPGELIDPATAAGKFFDRLVQVPGWRGMPPWNAGQTVQGSPSSDGGIYRDMYEQATGIVTTLTTTAGGTAVAVPVANTDPGCGSPSIVQVATTDGGGSAAWGGYENGRIPVTALCPVPSAPGLLLECGAAAAFDQMNGAFRAVFGQDIGITDGYRSYDEQVACRAEKGSLCADPGTSNHGWAKAVDIGACCGVNSGSGAAFDWLTGNAARFGWVHPPWAQPGWSKPEPWHWEYGAIS